MNLQFDLPSDQSGLRIQHCDGAELKSVKTSACVCGVEDTELLLVLEGEVEFDEERVIQVGHHVPLSLHVLRLVLLHDVALLQDLNWTDTHTHFQLKGANI